MLRIGDLAVGQIKIKVPKSLIIIFFFLSGPFAAAAAAAAAPHEEPLGLCD